MRPIRPSFNVGSPESALARGRARFTPLDRLDRLYVGPRLIHIDPTDSKSVLAQIQIDPTAFYEKLVGPTGNDVGYPIGPLSETGNLADHCFTY